MRATKTLLKRNKTVQLPYDYVALIYNPNSTGKAAYAARRLRKYMQRITEAPIELTPTKASGHGKKIARALCKKYAQPLIISVSGDGGYHEVVNGIMDAVRAGEAKRPVCAVEAAGNANDHFMQMRTRETLRQAIKQNKLKPMELLKVEFRGADNKLKNVVFAHSYAGLGLTPQAVKELNKQQLNPVKEKVIVAKKMLDYKPINVAIKGKELEVNNIVAAKIAKMSKIVKLDRARKPAPAGKFRVLIEQGATKSSMIKHLVKAAFRGLQDQSMVTDTFSCRVLHETPIQLDGEVYNLKKGDTVTIRVESTVLETL